MMGIKTAEPRLFYFFSLNDKVPQGHPLRLIGENVDFSFVYELARPYYSHTGQPSIDPVVLLKMSLIGYLYSITSERKLADEIPLNMAYLWFLGYDIGEKTPDHSVLSKARARFGISLYQAFFQCVVKLCEEKGLIKGDKLFLDATYVKANASLDSLVERGLYHRLPGSTDDYLKKVWDENPVELERDDEGDVEAAGKEADLSQLHLPETPEKVRRLKANERYVSETDPDAALVWDERKGLFLAHKVHVGVDSGEARVITAVSVVPRGDLEAHYLSEMVEQHSQNTGKDPPEVVADGAYGTIANYDYLMATNIQPSIPRHKSWTAIAYPNDTFTYDPATDTMVCPQGQRLKRHEVRPRYGLIRYRASRKACRLCPIKTKCTRGERRSVTRIDNAALDWALRHLQREEAQLSIKQRKIWSETANAELKNQRGLSRASLRGRLKVSIQALLAATTYNLKRIAKYGKVESVVTCQCKDFVSHRVLLCLKSLFISLGHFRNAEPALSQP